MWGDLFLSFFGENRKCIVRNLFEDFSNIYESDSCVISIIYLSPPVALNDVIFIWKLEPPARAEPAKEKLKRKSSSFFILSKSNIIIESTSSENKTILLFTEPPVERIALGCKNRSERRYIIQHGWLRKSAEFLIANGLVTVGVKKD